MNFLDSGKLTIKADKKHENIYDLLNEKLGLEIHNIFFISLIIGYRNGVRASTFVNGRKEFRVSYLEDIQRSILYTIGNEVVEEKFFQNPDDEGLVSEIITEYQRYATAGMDIIINDIFKHDNINGQLNTATSDYDLKFIKYLYDELNVAPF